MSRRRGLNLPPTPSDFELVELVQRSLALIAKSSADTVRTVSERAYTGFGDDEAQQLLRQLAETSTLCRRCEHCLTRCNPRAVAAVGGGGGELLAEAARVTTEFETVAAAARSTVAQVRESFALATRPNL